MGQRGSDQARAGQRMGQGRLAGTNGGTAFCRRVEVW